MRPLLIESSVQGWTQIVELGCALLLSAIIGLERELRQKSAGLRTHTLIGFGSALIMLVSKYGFYDVVSEHVSLDPSRVAAQIVSGIGFIGGGLIFVRRDAVRGLTTAAAVWLTTAVGMAAGAGLLLLATVTTAGYLLVVHGFGPLSRRLQRSWEQVHPVSVTYRDGQGLLRRILADCTAQGWSVARLFTRHHLGDRGVAGHNLSRRDLVADEPDHPWAGSVSVVMELRGSGDVGALVSVLAELPGVLEVETMSVEDLEDLD